jgi:hypothetical protein
MVFNDTTTKDGIIQHCEDLCNLGDTGITGNSVLFKKFASNVNIGNKKVAAAIMKVDKMWKFDDFNYTDFPRGTVTLVANQKDYTLPAATASGNASTLLGVTKIAVLDTNSTPQEKTLVLTNMSEADLNNMYPVAGLPCVYRLVGNSVKMWPAPSSTYCTLASGLIVYFQRTPKPFDTTTTDSIEPGFLSTHHILLSYYASYLYLIPKDTKLATSYLQLFNSGIDDLQVDYSNMNDDNRSVIQIRQRSSR